MGSPLCAFVKATPLIVLVVQRGAESGMQSVRRRSILREVLRAEVMAAMGDDDKVEGGVVESKCGVWICKWHRCKWSLHVLALPKDRRQPSASRQPSNSSSCSSSRGTRLPRFGFRVRVQQTNAL